jgi:hypothetical protein
MSEYYPEQLALILKEMMLLREIIGTFFLKNRPFGPEKAKFAHAEPTKWNLRETCKRNRRSTEFPIC